MKTAIAVLLVAVLVACGSDSDSKETSAPKVTSAPASTGSDSTSTQPALDTTTRPSEPVAPTLAEADLEGMLLRVGDMPSGWSESPEGEGGDSAIECAKEADGIVEGLPLASAGFSAGASGFPGFRERLVADTKVFDELKGVYSGCAQFTFEIDGVSISGSYLDLSAEPLAGADEQAMWRIVLDADGSTIEGYQSLVVAGDVLLSTFYIDEPSADLAEFEEFTTAALARITGQ